MRFSIFGAGGYIGSQLALWLETKGFEVLRFGKGDESWRHLSLGHVVYAAGMTAGFRDRPELCVGAHAGLLAQILNERRFEALTYCSSTRLYGHRREFGASEEDDICMAPGLDAVYNSSKLLGESLCLSQQNRQVRVIRLSNVYGPMQPENSFISQVLGSVKVSGYVEIGEARTSEKDYIFISDVLELIYKVTVAGEQRLYNLASGQSISHQKLAEFLARAGYRVSFTEHGEERKLASIDISKIKKEFSFQPVLMSEGIRSTLLHTG